MAKLTVIEHLESIATGDAAHPFDGIITQVFTNTVNVKLVGSRTIIRDVALADGINADDLRVSYPVLLGQSGARRIVLAYFEQFADPESFNYAGVGVKIPGRPTVSVQSWRTGWYVRWPKVSGATKYVLYRNDSPIGESPEEIAQILVTDPNQQNYQYGPVGYEAPFKYFAVKAFNGMLEGEVSLWLTDETPPSVPKNIGHTYTTQGHVLTWEHTYQNDVGTFRVYRHTSPTDEGATEVLDTRNLTALVAYNPLLGDYFGVQSLDWAGNASAIVWAGPYDPTPTMPNSFDANLVESGGYVCNWSGDTLRTLAYEVEAATDDQGTGVMQVWQGLALTSPVHRLTGYKYYRVRAQGYDLTFSDWTAWETDTNPPPKPTLTATGGLKSVTIGLAAEDTSHTAIGFSHYLFQIADGAAGQNAQTLDGAAKYESFPRTLAQAAGVTKYYRLTPFDWGGLAGPASDWTPAIPADASYSIKEKWDTYGSRSLSAADTLYWLRLADMESGESWTVKQVSTSTTPVVSYVSDAFQGVRSLKLSFSAVPWLNTLYYLSARLTWSAKNLAADSRWQSNSDLCAVHWKTPAATAAAVRLRWCDGDPANEANWKGPALAGVLGGSGGSWLKQTQPKGDYSGINWANIRGVELYAGIYVTSLANDYLLLDCLDIIKTVTGWPDYVGLSWQIYTATDPNH